MKQNRLSEDRLLRAVDFVTQHGDGPTQALARFSAGQLGADETLAAFGAYQLPDGGWMGIDKDFVGDISIVSCTHVALDWLAAVDPDDERLLPRTLSHLKAIQRDDGSFDEPESILKFDPPVWMRPGDAAIQAWLTAAVLCRLHELGQQEAIDFDGGMAFLRTVWDGSRFPHYTHTHWVALPLFASGDAKDRETALACRAVLTEAIEAEAVDLGDAAAIATGSWLAGEVGSQLLDQALEMVLASQDEDGGWKTSYGEKHRVAMTVAALVLLRKLDLI